MKNKDLLDEFHLLAEKLKNKNTKKEMGDFLGGSCIVNNEKSNCY